MVPRAAVQFVCFKDSSMSLESNKNVTAGSQLVGSI